MTFRLFHLEPITSMLALISNESRPEQRFYHSCMLVDWFDTCFCTA
ncbi:hypothetical protein LINPERHAP1_LOCUS19097, partial [Linum perenne]